MPGVTKILIDKYLKGECSQEEEQRVVDWLEENDLDTYKQPLQEKNTNKKIKKKWEEMIVRFPELQVAEDRNKGKSRKRWLVAAVSVGIIFLGVLVVLWSSSLQKGTRYTTGFGEVKSIVLPDGTNITLNATSSITLNKTFNEKERVVFLSGQAFFKVKDKANCPFVVKTSQIDIKVLGTSFDVSAFENEPDISVALKDGKVLMQSNYFKKEYKKGLFLNPGEEAVFKKNTKDLTFKKYNKKTIQAWQRQNIYFNNADIDKVLQKLHRFYGVSFNTDHLRKRNWQLSGEYKNQTLTEVLESLSFNYNLKYEMKDKQVILYNKD